MVFNSFELGSGNPIGESQMEFRAHFSIFLSEIYWLLGANVWMDYNGIGVISKKEA